MTAAPSVLTVGVTSTSADKAQCQAAWTGPADAVKYPWTGGYNDGSAHVSGTANASPLTFEIPYHTSGQPGSAWFCVKSQNAAGAVSIDQTCTGFTVPAKPVIPPTDTVPAPVAITQSVSVMFKGTPPDAAGGWKMQLFESSEAISKADHDAPYEITIGLKTGSHAVKAVWTKGTVIKTSDPVTVVCA